MAKPKGATSYRLSNDAQKLLSSLADQLGLSKTAVLEMAIRKLARAELGEAIDWASLPVATGRSVPAVLARQSPN